jgi:hypothetical protein
MRHKGVTEQTLNIRGRQSVNFELGGSKFSHTFLVCTLPTDAVGLLGTDFLGADAVINFEQQDVACQGCSNAPSACRVADRNSTHGFHTG